MTIVNIDVETERVWGCLKKTFFVKIVNVFRKDLNL